MLTMLKNKVVHIFVYNLPPMSINMGYEREIHMLTNKMKINNF